LRQGFGRSNSEQKREPWQKLSALHQPQFLLDYAALVGTTPSDSSHRGPPAGLVKGSTDPGALLRDWREARKAKKLDHRRALGI
jgi:hypothetical protein